MTYVALSAGVLLGIVLLTWRTVRALRPGPLLWTAAVLVALTLAFDNLIVGVGIVDYDDALILGLRVPTAPIEDFAYALAAVLIMPALWTMLGSRKGAHDGA